MKQIPQEKMDALLKLAGEKMGVDPALLQKAAQNGQLDGLLSKMKQSDVSTLQQALTDKKTAEKLLSTPQAKDLLQQLLKDK